MINWQYFPRSQKAPEIAIRVIKAFEQVIDQIDSDEHELHSNAVLAHVADGLREAGFQVESGRKAHEKIDVPVLFGMNGEVEKSFEVDAYSEQEGFVVEVEAGAGVANNQFLKDLFKACAMHGVRYLCIALRQNYGGRDESPRVLRRPN
ncbi:MAG: hypothetical protein ACYSWU_21945 [Planctomycetota bacterium]|jgi:hypothetical protein